MPFQLPGDVKNVIHKIHVVNVCSKCSIIYLMTDGGHWMERLNALFKSHRPRLTSGTALTIQDPQKWVIV